jgi:hypothetical protein
VETNLRLARLDPLLTIVALSFPFAPFCAR